MARQSRVQCRPVGERSQKERLLPAGRSPSGESTGSLRIAIDAAVREWIVVFLDRNREVHIVSVDSAGDTLIGTIRKDGIDAQAVATIRRGANQSPRVTEPVIGEVQPETALVKQQSQPGLGCTRIDQRLREREAGICAQRVQRRQKASDIAIRELILGDDEPRLDSAGEYGGSITIRVFQ